MQNAIKMIENRKAKEKKDKKAPLRAGICEV
jgi:hypothetical protein